MSTIPAFVVGNKRNAVAKFIEDQHGDLVDIEYCCISCRYSRKGEAMFKDSTKAEVWPAYQFNPDGSTYCQCCGRVINQVRRRC